MISETLLKKEFVRQASQRGLQVRPDALGFVLTRLTNRDKSSLTFARNAFQKLLDYLASHSQGDTIDLPTLLRVLGNPDDTLVSTSNTGTSTSSNSSSSASNSGSSHVSGASGIELSAIHIISAFETPKLVFHPTRNIYLLEPVAAGSKPRILAPAISRVQLYKDRFHLAQFRTMRAPAFQRDSFQRAERDLTPIQALLGDSSRSRYKTVLGMLVRLATNVTEQAVLSSSSSSSSSSNHSWNHNSNQQQHQQHHHQQQQDEAASVATTGRSIQPEWFLEDATSYVPLDLSSPDLIRASGFFTECSFALVEGIYVNGIFRVTAIAQPVAETRLSSIRSLASSDALAKSLGYDYHAPSSSSSSSSMSGGMNTVAMDATQTQMMEAMQDARMMVLSDVHLDDASVMDRLEALFARLNDSDQVSMPQLCVMMGNFLSHAFGSRPNDHALFTTSFDALGQMLLRFPEVVSRMRFVFVPGPGDPSLGGAAVPRPPMPESFTKLFRESIPSAVFTTNPARIRFYGKEIVVFRQNLMSKMRRHAVLAPNLQETRDLSEHLIKTIIDQAHLSPLPMTAQPVYWELDRAMQLYPLPDMLVLGDTCTTYSWRYSECQAFNPGVFSMEAKFAMISPAGAGSVDIFQV